MDKYINDSKIVISTCKEMMQQRKYNILEEYDDKIIFINSDGEKVCFFKTIISKFGIDRVTEFISIINELEIKHCILLYDLNVTSSANKILQDLNDIQIELFNKKELLYNITKHELVPTHIKVSSKEYHSLKQKCDINFGTLYHTDPVVKFYNFRPGDLIKIIRKNKNIAYRIVKKKSI